MVYDYSQRKTILEALGNYFGSGDRTVALIRLRAAGAPQWLLQALMEHDDRKADRDRYQKAI